MKKKTIKPQDDDMLPEYDLTGKKGVRGKYAKSLKKRYSIRVLKADGTVDEFDILIKQARKQAKVLNSIRRRRFTPPKDAPTSLELLKEDRSR